MIIYHLRSKVLCHKDTLFSDYIYSTLVKLGLLYISVYLVFNHTKCLTKLYKDNDMLNLQNVQHCKFKMFSCENNWLFEIENILCNRVLKVSIILLGIYRLFLRT